jgi:glycine cleavage system H protein
MPESSPGLTGYAYTFSGGPFTRPPSILVIDPDERPVMSIIPEELSYTAEHEWVSAPNADGVVRVGITDFAQDALGDVVYAQMPEVGTKIKANDVIGEVESTKSVSDIYAPVSGEVVSRNEALDTDSALINSDPYGEGWLMEIRLAEADAVESLLSASEYEQQVG